MTEANLRGQTGDMRSVYEVACANNFGYLALTGKEATAEAAAIEPAFIECSEAKVTYDRQLAATPDAPPPPKCDLPTNDNFLAVYTSMAAQAGLDCTVDDGIIVGRKGAISVYEIGCAGVQGARINRTAENGWEKASCLELAQANVTCTYTTKEETIASAKAWFASNEATNCDISDVRYMGANANGAFYEAACNGKEGFIARLNNAKAVEQVYACSVAQQIGDGCKLSTVEAAPAA